MGQIWPEQYLGLSQFCVFISGFINFRVMVVFLEKENSFLRNLNMLADVTTWSSSVMYVGE